AVTTIRATATVTGTTLATWRALTTHFGTFSVLHAFGHGHWRGSNNNGRGFRHHNSFGSGRWRSFDRINRCGSRLAWGALGLGRRSFFCVSGHDCDRGRLFAYSLCSLLTRGALGLGSCGLIATFGSLGCSGERVSGDFSLGATHTFGLGHFFSDQG